MGQPKPRQGGIDVKTCLETITGSAGMVEMEYGGFAITVVDAASFPWYDVFSFLTGASFDIWVEKRDTNLVIKAKQKID